MRAPSAKAVLTEFMGRLAASKESVLLVDYDGTLAPFQALRDRAYPYPGVEHILARIVQCGKSRVIVLTGRPVRELQTLFRPLHNLEVWGSHGMEHLLGDGTYQQTATDPEVAAVLGQAETWLTAEGLIHLAEIKPGGIAIHWRGELDSEISRVEALARKGMAPFAEQPGLKLLNFDAGLELRVAHPDKGDALGAILEGLAPHTAIAFLGDDLTDEDAFRALGDRGLCVLVRPEYRDTRAKIWLKPPHELIDFLKQWLNSISPSITERGSP